MAALTIDTSSALSTISPSSVYPHGFSRTTDSHHGRVRSLSSASTSSSLSITSPDPSSSNASSSSLNLPHTGKDPNATPGPSSLSHASPMDSPTEDRYSPDLQEEYVLAMHDFVPQQPNATCLSFRAGQVIHVLNRDPSGWWDGEFDGKRGWFPSNYVNKDVTPLIEEELPESHGIRKGHTHTPSAMSVASWASTPSPNHHHAFPNHARDRSNSSISMVEESNSCPPIMVSLLHGLQLLQNAVRARRPSHYQPSVACIISCIRAVLSETDCLPREAPILRRFNVLAQERKNVLAELASLVAQAKKASVHYANEDEREPEEGLMLRLSGQVFARVRRFLAVAVQCGIELPERYSQTEGSSTAYDSTDTEGRDELRMPYGFVPPPESSNEEMTMHKTSNGSMRRVSRQREQHVTAARVLRAKSMGDLRKERAKALNDDISEDSCTPLIQRQDVRMPSRKQEQYINPRAHAIMRAHGDRSSHRSISSTSSFSSSSSSYDSYGTPVTPSFPAGPCTSTQVLSILRATHDNLLSTIAAFIGHVHSHSRSAHASSTGHLYELVRQIVEIVCKLLAIVEAIMHHPEVPLTKTVALKAANDNLYGVTSSLASCVREMTTNNPPQLSEDDEKRSLLRFATDALKAGSDCVGAVKVCLGRSIGEDGFIVTLSSPPKDMPTAFSPRGDASRIHNGPLLKKSPSMGSLHTPPFEDTYVLHREYEEEDITIQGGQKKSTSSTGPPHPPSFDVSASGSPPLPASDREKDLTSNGFGLSFERKPTALRINSAARTPELDYPSPVSVIRTEGDGTTWEGSNGFHAMPSLEDKLINGELPSVPSGQENVDSDPLTFSLSHDYGQHDVAYNSEGHLVGATLSALVEKMTPHDSIVEPAFSAVFFLTFRLFSTPVELLDTLVARYNLTPPPGLSDSDNYVWQQRKAIPIKLRVSNFIKLWLENYWRPETDGDALPLLMVFVKDTMSVAFMGASQRIMDLINVRILDIQSVSSPIERNKVSDRFRDTGMPLNPSTSTVSSEIPRPMMTKALLAALRAKTFASIAITDFDALELARQLTIIECNLYCTITPEEMLEMGQTPAVNVKALSSLSTVITGWVAESILNEHDTKKRTMLIKFFIKVADRCTSINNFSTPRSILAALESSTIARLHQTWTGLPQKNKAQLEALRKLADHARNYHSYRSRLRNTAPPAVPFLGLYLTDLTFCREGNASERTSPTAPGVTLLNFNKYQKLARIVQDMQRFQVPYTLKEIPEVQGYLQYCFEKSKHHGDLEDLYRRSLLVEPKQPADHPPANELKQLFGWGNRSQTSQSTI